jgi:hypothetical protein
MANNVAAADDAATKTNYISRSWVAWAIFLAWGYGIYSAANAGMLTPSADQLPVGVLLALFGPPTLFIILYKTVAPLRAYVATLDAVELTALQSWRVVGAGFLFGWSLNFLPTVFVMPAALGDIAVGIAAPFAAIALARGLPNGRRSAWVIVWTGLIDFLFALIFGVLSREGAPLQFEGEPYSNILSSAPYGMIPNFVVPAFIILHIMAIIKLRQTR